MLYDKKQEWCIWEASPGKLGAQVKKYWKKEKFASRFVGTFTGTLSECEKYCAELEKRGYAVNPLYKAESEKELPDFMLPIEDWSKSAGKKVKKQKNKAEKASGKTSLYDHYEVENQISIFDLMPEGGKEDQ